MPGLYIHIPFCVQKCRYCDFPSGESITLADDYLSALFFEMDMVSAKNAGLCFDTVFVGGGTPSLLPVGRMSAVMTAVRKHFMISEYAEVTVECNPGTVTDEKFAEYADCGVNRLSIGLQSGSDEILTAIGRVHTRYDYIQAMLSAIGAGISNINTDLMYGLPHQNALDFLESVKLASDLGARHISAYSLILEPETPLFDDVLASVVTLPTADETADMQDAGVGLLERLGYRRYEISNFAYPGFECRHNINYWKNGEYLGIGCAAHSALRNDGVLYRSENIRGAAAYISSLKAGELPMERSTESSRDDELFETIMVGLRMIEGISLEDYKARFASDFVDDYSDVVDGLIAEELMILENGFARLTSRGLDIQNTVLLRFM